MMNTLYPDYATGLGAPGWIHAYGLSLLLLVVWSIFWKGLALWHSGRRGNTAWFIILLVVNTAGILDIIYLFFIAGLRWANLFRKNTETVHVHHEHSH